MVFTIVCKEIDVTPGIHPTFNRPLLIDNSLNF